MSGVEGARTRDSGTKRQTITMAAATRIALTTNSQRQERWSTMTPLRAMPTPPPMPSTADTVPMATARRSSGNSSRMIPKLSGKDAPPTPWTTRKAISTPTLGAKMAPTEPSRNTPRVIIISRFLPYWSPRRPTIGVLTAPLSRYAVTVQVTQVALVPSSRWRSGRAGIRKVCISAYAPAAVIRPARVRRSDWLGWCEASTRISAWTRRRRDGRGRARACPRGRALVVRELAEDLLVEGVGVVDAAVRHLAPGVR